MATSLQEHLACQQVRVGKRGHMEGTAASKSYKHNLESQNIVGVIQIFCPFLLSILHIRPSNDLTTQIARFNYKSPRG